MGATNTLMESLFYYSIGMAEKSRILRDFVDASIDMILDPGFEDSLCMCIEGR